MSDEPDDRDERRERLRERMEPGPVTVDREPVGGPIPELTEDELRELGIDPDPQ